ncbi:hypothetical protein D3C80_1775310 [compost metagenome]
MGALSSPQPAREMAMASSLAEARGIRIMTNSFARVFLEVHADVYATPQHNAKDLHFAQRVIGNKSHKAVQRISVSAGRCR